MNVVDEVVNEVKNCLHQDDIGRLGKPIGKGLFSEARLHKGLVIKLGGCWNPDPGGRFWAEWCVDHQDLDCVPKIHTYVSFGDNQYVVVMEHLLPVETVDSMEQYEMEVIARFIECDAADDEVEIPLYIHEFMDEFRKVRELGCMDLHSNNYMVRESDGRMVIIDPFSTTSYKQESHLTTEDGD